MNIAKVCKEDISGLKDISRKAIIDSVEADDLVKRGIISDTIQHIEQNIASTECVFLKCGDEPVMGFVLVQDFWNLSDLFVTPTRHGEGIGSMLLNKAISACKHGNDKGYIRVNSSTNAERFYRKHGFVSFKPKKEAPSFVVPLIYRF